MRIGTWTAIYFVVWWLCLFLVLPFVARSKQSEADFVAGADPGAPIRPNWMMMLTVTSVISLVVLAVLWWLIENYWMT